MFKRMLMFLIPICVGSLIIAGVLQLILGPKRTDYDNGNAPLFFDSSPVDSSEDYPSYQEYMVLNGEETDEHYVNVYDSLTFKFSGVNAVINCKDDDKATVSVKNDNSERGIRVKLSAAENETAIEIHPTNITFDEQNEDQTNWKNDAFSSDIKSTVIISLPAKEYKKLVLEQGSGIVNINGINALSSDITLCTGRLSFMGDADYLPESLMLKTASGKATFENVHAKSCDLDLGSGSVDISGLMGTGTAKIACGTATMSFDSLSYMDINKDSGTFNLLLPPQTSAGIHAELQEGKIDVKTDVTEKNITESGYYSVGNENTSNLIKVKNMSGNIYITNNSLSSQS